MNLNQIWGIIVPTIIVIFILLFVWSKARKARRRPTLELYIEGLKALISGDDNLAFQRFKQVVSEDTNNIDAYLKLGDLFRKKNQLEKAFQIHRELTLRSNLINEQKKDILKSLACDYIDANSHEKAIATLDELERFDKHNLWTLEKLLEQYEILEKWEEAFEVANKIYKVKGEKDKKSLAYYKLLAGLKQAAEKEYHRARIFYKEALNYDENSALAFVLIGDAYYEDQRLDDAVQFWKKLLEVKPEAGFLVYYKLEKTLFEMGNFGEIIKIYNQILEKYPKDIFARFGLANIYEKKGDLQEAIATYKEILDIKPDYIPAIQSLITLYRQKGMSTQALNVVSELAGAFAPNYTKYYCKNCHQDVKTQIWRCPTCKTFNPLQV